MRYPTSLGLATLVVLLALALVHGGVAVSPSGAADAGSLPGLATLSGTVRASAPFKAAQVRLVNADKDVLFMVYTKGGRYRTVNLFPGTYEVTVRARGLDAAPQITDQPKLAISRDGAVWYTPRSSAQAAAGVLDPDVTRNTTLGAYR